MSAAMNCDALAPYYKAFEGVCFGTALEKRRFAFLPELKSAQRALLCGDGDGRFLTQLLKTNLRVQVDFVDMSPGMIRVARGRLAPLGEPSLRRVRFFAEDVRRFTPPDGPYDLVATHFFLDCFSRQQIGGVVQRIAGWMRPKAKWVLSDFSEGSRGFHRAWTHSVVRTLYAAFRLTTNLRVTQLPDIEGALRAAGLDKQQHHTALGGLLFSSLWNRAPDLH